MRAAIAVMALMLCGCGERPRAEEAPQKKMIGDTMPSTLVADYRATTYPEGIKFWVCCLFQSVELHLWLSPYAPVSTEYNQFMFAATRIANGGVSVEIQEGSGLPRNQNRTDAEYEHDGYQRVTEIWQ